VVPVKTIKNQMTSINIHTPLWLEAIRDTQRRRIAFHRRLSSWLVAILILTTINMIRVFL